MNRALAAIAFAAVGLSASVGHAQTVQGQIYVQPAPAPYQQQAQPQYQQQPVYGYQPQPQPRTEERVHTGLIVGGAVMLGVSWLVHGALISPFAGYSLDSGYQPEWESFRYVGLIPLAGPWIQLAIKPGTLSDDSWGPYLIIDGILQAGGLIMLICGASITETVTIYGDNEGIGPSLAFGVGPGSMSLSGTF